MELEQALKRILDLENENKSMTDEITSLKVVNEKLNTEIENKDIKENFKAIVFKKWLETPIWYR